ncbi:C40 family peptidase [Kutzneria buriramensis]|uniref:Cell wall-associated NlpC family hydrolase n=1 Tax=Kutzneria buriramensis TaxID=1045776 RepID=A0A3E0GXM8_9PSEU|nr:bifunctional lytic transglycosylase/C40 family peptidase [Kutzneria buriramensis]REH31024.1 cell wall-associated NlpC family hydrolase [Kutzneria buriramensis]
MPVLTPPRPSARRGGRAGRALAALVGRRRGRQAAAVQRSATQVATRVVARLAWRWIRRILLAKASVIILIVAVVIVAAWLAVLALAAGAASSANSAAGVPSSVPGLNPIVLDAITKAVGRAGQLAPGCTIRWSLLAGIGEVESNNAGGRTVAPNGDVSPPIVGPVLDGSGVGGNTTPMSERAQGPFQFMPSTWASVGQDGNGDGKRDPQNVYDAAAAAVVYLCGGKPADLTNPDQERAAIYRYNHSNAYVAQVMAAVARFDAYGTNPGAGGPAGPAVETAIAFALKQQGLPYVWGGNGPPSSAGFDCSGLTKAAYAQAGITLPRVAVDQFAVGPQVAGPGDGLAKLQRGDLLYWAYDPHNPATIHHVALYLGNNQMIEAADFGIPVRVRSVYFEGFAGATRPAAH